MTLVKRLLGYGTGSVEFIGTDDRGDFRCAAYDDGVYKVFTMPDNRRIPATSGIVKRAQSLLDAHARVLKLVSKRCPRAMIGPGVDY